MKKISSKSLLKTITPKKIIWPILVGLSVAAYLVVKDFDKEAFLAIEWDFYTLFWIGLALTMFFGRAYGYMARIRLLSDKHLSWKKSFDVIMLWEFASSITPSIIGGTAFAFFLLIKEKIGAGRSTAIVLITALLDELFFIILTPITILLVGWTLIFPSMTSTDLHLLFGGNSLIALFLIGYFILFAYTLFLVYGLFINPRGLKWILAKVATIGFLKKWKPNLLDAGDELIVASKEFKHKSVGFWLKALGATFITWFCRYMELNLIVLAFGTTIFSEQLLIFARQFILWIIMLIPVTPGGSGVAEIMFPIFLKGYLPIGLEEAVGVLWRLIGYYPYLIIGAILLPRWLRRVYSKKATM
ncbi:MAG: hypothetical protein ACJAZ3_001931 [Sphingobacteriales bacterium]|jgi:uncharacterized protein (TIRG00374 family)